MVAGAGGPVVDLFLCALRLRQHYGTRNGDVHTVPGRNHCSRSAALPGSFVPGLLLQSRRIIDTLWYDAGADLLWRRLRNPAALVAAGPAGFSAEYLDLDDIRIRLVETPRMVVGKLRPTNFSLSRTVG